MQRKSNIDIENISRLNEIAEVYNLTNQQEKSEKYHKNIIHLCDKYPKNEEILQFKIQSLNSLNKPYKSLETIKELLNMNPYSIHALASIFTYLRSD